MASVIIASLSQSLRRVPPEAVPAILDCILASTDLSPSSLFASLLDSFPNLTEDVVKIDVKMDADQCNYITCLVGALCHLLKQIVPNPNSLQSFMWRIFVPLITMVSVFDREMLNKISESFIDVVIDTNSWEVVEATLVPFSIRSAAHSMDMLQNEKLNMNEGDKSSIFLGRNGFFDESEMDKEWHWTPKGSFPLPISCHILTLMLGAALQNKESGQSSDPVVENGSCNNAEKFASKLIWELCNLTELLLSQTLDHRSSAIGFLLPVIFKAFLSHYTFEISIRGQTHVLSRNCFFVKIWKCCRTLFSFGALERRDAYNILSLYLCYFSCNEEREDNDMYIDQKLDITAEKDFWDEIKRGLVDKEGLVRKQSLHILKKALCVNGGREKSGVTETTSCGKSSNTHGETKRERWANKEAESLGVGKICTEVNLASESQRQWEAFVLLYEMLEEYGTHLIEAAWNHQVSLLLQMSLLHVTTGSSINEMNYKQIGASGEIISWLSILWERGFHHDNPLVRSFIMQSFLEIEWENHGLCLKLIPETFVLGPFMQALNDPVHHKDFGAKGVYSSRTIDGAACFCQQYISSLDARTQITFLLNLASAAKKYSFGRAGLMCIAECIASAACEVRTHDDIDVEFSEDTFLGTVLVDLTPPSYPHNDKSELLDTLRFVIESSKQHFNPKYRLKVCAKVLEAVASVLCTYDVPLQLLLHFISLLPRDFTDYGGSLRVKVQKWLSGCGKNFCGGNCCSAPMKLLTSLHDLPQKFISHNCSDASVTYDDEELVAWECEAKRWTRVLFLTVNKEFHLTPLIMFIQRHGMNICKQGNILEWLPVKFLILILSLVQELQLIQERAVASSIKDGATLELVSLEIRDHTSCMETAIFYDKFSNTFLFVLEELVSFSCKSCSIFWSSIAVEETTLPSSVKGKLGGPSQRRLSSSAATAVLLAITSVKAVASISFWCKQFQNIESLDSSITFMWKFFQKTISLPPCGSEVEAETCLAAYEALTPVLKVLASVFHPQAFKVIGEEKTFVQLTIEGKPLLDSLSHTFLQHTNDLLSSGALARARRAVLLNWKWLCLESLLSIPYHVEGIDFANSCFFFSEGTLKWIFGDLVESLENAGEGSILPMLRSVRLALGLFSKGKSGVLVSSCNGVDAEMMWHLVHSSWILHVSCNKRRVAHVAALLSSVLHHSVFSDKNMHLTDSGHGPLKWVVEKVLEEGTKSPRTFRLAALHLTGMWLSYPSTIEYYIKELKLLSLYGSIAFDEDFEAELAEYHARTEVSLLAKSVDPELTEMFMNTELYARVSVAVLFNKLADLADMVGSKDENEDCYPALESGKSFLLELLDSAINDNDLSKELYKKYSAIHRRKIRTWQMICVLSRFVDQDIVQQVTHSLHICLYRNNLPAVRQYLETFAINVYLKFPSLVGDQLVPILRDSNMRPQALSSYVFIAANIIIHANEVVQSKHLHELLPPIVPQLTSHHHSLRGFTQLLVYRVLCRFPLLESSEFGSMTLEKRCFDDLKSYLEKNSDCVRLRRSMEGFLDAYNPKSSVTPAGIFVNRVEELEFECVPTSLLEHVLTFLNDVREDLRCSMANDMMTIKNESFKPNEDSNPIEIMPIPQETSLDFQKKITLSKHEKQPIGGNSFLSNEEAYKQQLEMEKDDQLLHQLLLSRNLSMEGVGTSRQQIFVVASLLDRIPNLAGLARTCEVFKAAGLAIGDLTVLGDKQFQLISVTAEKWVPMIEVPVNSMKVFLEKKKREGFSILGLEQTANSMPLDKYNFPRKSVLVLGREKEGIPVDIIHILDACVEIPQLGVVRSLNVHVSGAIALWEYTRQQRCL